MLGQCFDVYRWPLESSVSFAVLGLPSQTEVIIGPLTTVVSEEYHLTTYTANLLRLSCPTVETREVINFV